MKKSIILYFILFIILPAIINISAGIGFNINVTYSPKKCDRFSDKDMLTVYYIHRADRQHFTESRVCGEGAASFTANKNYDVVLSLWTAPRQLEYYITQAQIELDEINKRLAGLSDSDIQSMKTLQNQLAEKQLALLKADYNEQKTLLDEIRNLQNQISTIQQKKLQPCNNDGSLNPLFQSNITQLACRLNPSSNKYELAPYKKTVYQDIMNIPESQDIKEQALRAVLSGQTHNSITWKKLYEMLKDTYNPYWIIKLIDEPQSIDELIKYFKNDSGYRIDETRRDELDSYINQLKQMKIKRDWGIAQYVANIASKLAISNNKNPISCLSKNNDYFLLKYDETVPSDPVCMTGGFKINPNNIFFTPPQFTKNEILDDGKMIFDTNTDFLLRNNFNYCSNPNYSNCFQNTFDSLYTCSINQDNLQWLIDNYPGVRQCSGGWNFNFSFNFSLKGELNGLTLAAGSYLSAKYNSVTKKFEISSWGVNGHSSVILDSITNPFPDKAQTLDKIAEQYQNYFDSKVTYLNNLAEKGLLDDGIKNKVYSLPDLIEKERKTIMQGLTYYGVISKQNTPGSPQQSYYKTIFQSLINYQSAEVRENIENMKTDAYNQLKDATNNYSLFEGTTSEFLGKMSTLNAQNTFNTVKDNRGLIKASFDVSKLSGMIESLGLSPSMSIDEMCTRIQKAKDLAAARKIEWQDKYTELQINLSAIENTIKELEKKISMSEYSSEYTPEQIETFKTQLETAKDDYIKTKKNGQDIIYNYKTAEREEQLYTPSFLIEMPSIKSNSIVTFKVNADYFYTGTMMTQAIFEDFRKELMERKPSGEVTYYRIKYNKELGSQYLKEKQLVFNEGMEIANRISEINSKLNDPNLSIAEDLSLRKELYYLELSLMENKNKLKEIDYQIDKNCRTKEIIKTLSAAENQLITQRNINAKIEDSIKSTKNDKDYYYNLIIQIVASAEIKLDLNNNVVIENSEINELFSPLNTKIDKMKLLEDAKKYREKNGQTQFFDTLRLKTYLTEFNNLNSNQSNLLTEYSKKSSIDNVIKLYEQKLNDALSKIQSEEGLKKLPEILKNISDEVKLSPTFKNAILLSGATNEDFSNSTFSSLLDKRLNESTKLIVEKNINNISTISIERKQELYGNLPSWMLNIADQFNISGSAYLESAKTAFKDLFIPQAVSYNGEGVLGALQYTLDLANEAGKVLILGNMIKKTAVKGAEIVADTTSYLLFNTSEEIAFRGAIRNIEEGLNSYVNSQHSQSKALADKLAKGSASTIDKLYAYTMDVLAISPELAAAQDQIKTTENLIKELNKKAISNTYKEAVDNTIYYAFKENLIDETTLKTLSDSEKWDLIKKNDYLMVHLNEQVSSIKPEFINSETKKLDLDYSKNDTTEKLDWLFSNEKSFVDYTSESKTFMSKDAQSAFTAKQSFAFDAFGRTLNEEELKLKIAANDPIFNIKGEQINLTKLDPTAEDFKSAGFYFNEADGKIYQVSQINFSDKNTIFDGKYSKVIYDEKSKTYIEINKYTGEYNCVSINLDESKIRQIQTDMFQKQKNQIEYDMKNYSEILKDYNALDSNTEKVINIKNNAVIDLNKDLLKSLADKAQNVSETANLIESSITRANDIIKDSYLKIEISQHNLSSLANDLSDFKSQITSEKNKTQTLLTTTQADKLKNEEKLNSLNSEIQDLEGKIASIQTNQPSLIYLKESLLEKINNINSLKEELKQKEAQQIDFQNSINSSRKEYEDLKTNYISEIESKKANLELDIKNLEENIAMLKKVGASNDILLTFEQELAAKKKLYDDFLFDYSLFKRNDILESEKPYSTIFFKDYQNLIALRKESYDSANAMKNEIQSLNNEISTKEEELLKLNEIIALYENGPLSSENSLKLFNELLEKKKAEKLNVQNNIDQQIQDIDNLNKQITKLDTLNNSAEDIFNSQKTRLEKEIESYNSKIDLFSNEAKAYKDTLSFYKKELSLLEKIDIIKEKFSQNIDISNELSGLNKELKESGYSDLKIPDKDEIILSTYDQLKKDITQYYEDEVKYMAQTSDILSDLNSKSISKENYPLYLKNVFSSKIKKDIQDSFDYYLNHITEYCKPGYEEKHKSWVLELKSKVDTSLNSDNFYQAFSDSYTIFYNIKKYENMSLLLGPIKECETLYKKSLWSTDDLASFESNLSKITGSFFSYDSVKTKENIINDLLKNKENEINLLSDATLKENKIAEYTKDKEYIDAFLSKIKSNNTISKAEIEEFNKILAKLDSSAFQAPINNIPAQDPEGILSAYYNSLKESTGYTYVNGHFVKEYVNDYDILIKETRNPDGTTDTVSINQSRTPETIEGWENLLKKEVELLNDPGLLRVLDFNQQLRKSGDIQGSLKNELENILTPLLNNSPDFEKQQTAYLLNRLNAPKFYENDLEIIKFFEIKYSIDLSKFTECYSAIKETQSLYKIGSVSSADIEKLKNILNKYGFNLSLEINPTEILVKKRINIIKSNLNNAINDNTIDISLAHDFIDASDIIFSKTGYTKTTNLNGEIIWVKETGREIELIPSLSNSIDALIKNTSLIRNNPDDLESIKMMSEGLELLGIKNRNISVDELIDLLVAERNRIASLPENERYAFVFDKEVLYDDGNKVYSYPSKIPTTLEGYKSYVDYLLKNQERYQNLPWYEKLKTKQSSEILDESNQQLIFDSIINNTAYDEATKKSMLEDYLKALGKVNENKRYLEITIPGYEMRINNPYYSVISSIWTGLRDYTFTSQLLSLRLGVSNFGENIANIINRSVQDSLINALDRVGLGNDITKNSISQMPHFSTLISDTTSGFKEVLKDALSGNDQFLYDSKYFDFVPKYENEFFNLINKMSGFMVNDHFAKSALFKEKLRQEIETLKAIPDKTEAQIEVLAILNKNSISSFRDFEPFFDQFVNHPETLALLKNKAENIEAYAMTTVLQNDNILTDLSKRIQGSLNLLSTGGLSKTYGLGSLLFTFIKVPVNVSLQIYKYSPINFIKTCLFDYTQYSLKLRKYSLESLNGMTEIEKESLKQTFLENMSAGINGLGLWGAGVGLWYLGVIQIDPNTNNGLIINWSNLFRIIKGDTTKDSLSANDVISNFNWTLFGNSSNLAATMMDNAYSEGDKLAFTFEIMKSLAFCGFNEGFLKRLFGIFGDNFENIGDINQVKYKLLTLIASMPTKMIPSIIQNFRNLTDEYVRKTYDSDDLTQTVLNKLINAIPGLSDQLEIMLDKNGNPLTRADAFNALSALISPIAVHIAKGDEGAIMLVNLYLETHDPSILPRNIDALKKIGTVEEGEIKSLGFTYTDQNGHEIIYILSGSSSNTDERTKFQEKYYDNLVKLLYEIQKDSSLTSDEKIAKIKEAQETALKNTEKEIIENRLHDNSGKTYAQSEVYSQMTIEEYQEIQLLQKSYLENQKIADANGYSFYSQEEMKEAIKDFWKRMYETKTDEEGNKLSVYREIELTIDKINSPNEYFEKLRQIIENRTSSKEIEIINAGDNSVSQTIARERKQEIIIDYLSTKDKIAGIQITDEIRKDYKQRAQDILTTGQDSAKDPAQKLNETEISEIKNYVDERVQVQSQQNLNNFIDPAKVYAEQNKMPNAFYTAAGAANQSNFKPVTLKQYFEPVFIPKDKYWSFTPYYNPREYLNYIEMNDRDFIWFDGPNSDESNIVASLNPFYNIVSLLNEIHKAKSKIYIALYGLTNKSPIWKVLLDELKSAISRGVKVYIVTDDKNVEGSPDQFDALTELLIYSGSNNDPIFDNFAYVHGNSNGLMHDKYLLIDPDSAKPTLCTSSLNWSIGSFRQGSYEIVKQPFYTLKGAGVELDSEETNQIKNDPGIRTIDFANTKLNSTYKKTYINLSADNNFVINNYLSDPEYYIIESSNTSDFSISEIYTDPTDNNIKVCIIFNPSTTNSKIATLTLRKKSNYLDGSGNPIYNGHLNNLYIFRDKTLASLYSEDFTNMLSRNFSTSKASGLWDQALKTYINSKTPATLINNIPIMPFFTPYQESYPYKEYLCFWEGTVLKYNNLNTNKGDSMTMLIDLIKQAKSEVVVMAYGLADKALLETLATIFPAQEIVNDGTKNTLVDHPENYYKVRVYIEQGQYNAYDPSTQERIKFLNRFHPVYLHSSSSLLHIKAVIIDKKIISAGSYNFSSSASQRNDENFFFITSPDIANLYSKLEKKFGWQSETNPLCETNFKFPFANSETHYIKRLSDEPTYSWTAYTSKIEQEISEQNLNNIQNQNNQQNNNPSGAINVDQNIKDYVNEIKSYVFTHNYFFYQSIAVELAAKINQFMTQNNVLISEGIFYSIVSMRFDFSFTSFYRKRVSSSGGLSSKNGPCQTITGKINQWLEIQDNDLKAEDKKTYFTDSGQASSCYGVLYKANDTITNNQTYSALERFRCLPYQNQIIPMSSWNANTPPVYCKDGNYIQLLGGKIERLALKPYYQVIGRSCSSYISVCGSYPPHPCTKTKCNNIYGYKDYLLNPSFIPTMALINNFTSLVISNGRLFYKKDEFEFIKTTDYNSNPGVYYQFQNITDLPEYKVRMLKNNSSFYYISSDNKTKRQYTSVQSSYGIPTISQIATYNATYPYNQTTPVDDREYTIIAGWSVYFSNGTNTISETQLQALPKIQRKPYEPSRIFFQLIPDSNIMIEYNMKGQQYYNTGDYIGKLIRAKANKPIMIFNGIIDKQTYDSLPANEQAFYTQLNQSPDTSDLYKDDFLAKGIQPSMIYINTGWKISKYTIDSGNKRFSYMELTHVSRTEYYDIPASLDKLQNLSQDYPEITPPIQFYNSFQINTSFKITPPQMKAKIYSYFDSAKTDIKIVAEDIDSDLINDLNNFITSKNIKVYVISNNDLKTKLGPKIFFTKIPTVRSNYAQVDNYCFFLKTTSFSDFSDLTQSLFIFKYDVTSANIYTYLLQEIANYFIGNSLILKSTIMDETIPTMPRWILKNTNPYPIFLTPYPNFPSYSKNIANTYHIKSIPGISVEYINSGNSPVNKILTELGTTPNIKSIDVFTSRLSNEFIISRLYNLKNTQNIPITIKTNLTLFTVSQKNYLLKMTGLSVINKTNINENFIIISYLDVSNKLQKKVILSAIPFEENTFTQNDSFFFISKDSDLGNTYATIFNSF